MRLLFLGSSAVTLAAFLFLPKLAVAVAVLSSGCRLVVLARIYQAKKQRAEIAAAMAAEAPNSAAWRPFEPTSR